MKTKHAVIILGISICLLVIGALFKVMHWPFAGMMLTVASFLEIIGIILLIYKIWTYPKVKEFLNW